MLHLKYYDAIFEYMSWFEGLVFMTGSEILDWDNEAAEQD